MFDKQMFAKRLKELRENTGLNQKECAEKLNISRGSISFYENGDRLPDIETIYNMATFFNVSADYLVGLTYVKTADMDIKAICKYLQLSEETIDRLHKANYFSLNAFESDMLGIRLYDCIDNNDFTNTEWLYSFYLKKMCDEFIKSDAFKSIISSVAVCKIISRISEYISQNVFDEEPQKGDLEQLDKFDNFSKKYKREYRYQIFDIEDNINNFIKNVAPLADDEKISLVMDLLYSYKNLKPEEDTNADD